MKKVKVAIAGVGSCASSLVQMASLNEDDSKFHGVMYGDIGGYKVNDIEFVCAFDVDVNKIGKDLSEAIFTSPNVAIKHVSVPYCNVVVEPGPLLDGISGNLSEIITADSRTKEIGMDDVVKRLREVEADVLVCYLPTGSYEAVRNYARAAAYAKVAFINATPEPVAQDAELQNLFMINRVPLLGDDIRSHLGSTTLHTALIELLHSRGVKVVNTYQLNFGGNADFLNLSSPTRSASKQKSKRNALNSAGIDASKVAAGPNGYVEYLGDTKVCYLRIEGSSVLGSQISTEIRLQVEDSPNSAGVIISAVRLAKLSIDRGLFGVIDDVCPMLFKSPRYGANESTAYKLINEFIVSK